jgi:hypothetical protein
MKTKLLFSTICTAFSLSLFATLPTEKAYYPLSTDLEPTVGIFLGMDNKGVTFRNDPAVGASVVDFKGAATSYVEMDPTLYNFTAVTLNIWFRCTTVDTWSRIFTFGAGNGNKLPEAFFTPADGRTKNTPAFGVDLTAGATTQSVIDITDTVTKIVANRWYMLTCCADITTGYFYLDGKLIYQRDLAKINTAPKDFVFPIAWLGKSGWPDPYFHGQMTKFRVYSKVLAASDIADLMTLDAIPTGVVSPPLTEISKPSINQNINIYSKDSRIFVDMLKSSKIASVAVYDLTGKMVQLKTALDISSVQFQQGFYIVKVTGNNINYTSKLVVR